MLRRQPKCASEALGVSEITLFFKRGEHALSLSMGILHRDIHLRILFCKHSISHNLDYLFHLYYSLFIITGSFEYFILIIDILLEIAKMDSLSFDIDKLIKICRDNDAATVGVFGSVARGEDTSESDIDILVNFSRRKSLLDIVKLERELSTKIGRKVDLLTEAAISPYLRDRILSELKVIYEN